MGLFETWGEHRFTNIPCYLIFDQDLLETYSFVGRPPSATEGLDWVAQDDTLAELAAIGDPGSGAGGHRGAVQCPCPARR